VKLTTTLNIDLKLDRRDYIKEAFLEDYASFQYDKVILRLNIKNHLSLNLYLSSWSTFVAHLSIKDARNTKDTRGTPE